MSLHQSIEAHLSIVFDAISADVDNGSLPVGVMDIAILLIEAWPDGIVYTELELGRRFTIPTVKLASHLLRHKYALPVSESRHGFWIVRTAEEVREFEVRFRHKLPEPLMEDVVVTAAEPDDFLKSIERDVAAAEKRMELAGGETLHEMRAVVAHFKGQWPKGKTYKETELADLFAPVGVDEKEYDKIRRRVREHVRVLRTQFAMPIIASAKGYWIARNSEEAKDYTRRFIKTGWSSIVSRIETCDAFRKQYHVVEDVLGPLKPVLVQIGVEQEWERG